MDREAINVSTINKEVYDRLGAAIRTGTLPPGVKISLRSIADTLGVSTMPVREALREALGDEAGAGPSAGAGSDPDAARSRTP